MHGMSTKRVALVLLLCGFVQAIVTPTAAEAGLWRWIEELSGPGPFIGGTAEFRVRCWVEVPLGSDVYDARTAGGVSWKFPCPNKAEPGNYYRYSLNLEGGYLFSLNNPISYQRDGGEAEGAVVHLVPLEAFFYYQPRHGVEFGAGGGLYWFNSSQFASFGVPVLEVRADVRPFDMVLNINDTSKWANFRRMLTARVGAVFLPKRIDGTRFGAPAYLALNEPHEVLFTWGVVLDYGAVRTRRN
jgi:hypothetical protein